MTREEAIQDLKDILEEATSDKDAVCYVTPEDAEALNMAIEALHREEAEEKGYCHRIRPSNVEVVVRCKDCKNRARYAVCDFFAEDGFCPHGERSNHEQQKERE